VKAQAARAMGTVATKLGGTIAPATQKRLADLLLAALAGRTWAGKECVLRSDFFNSVYLANVWLVRLFKRCDHSKFNS
jgi:hypothetical protein